MNNKNFGALKTKFESGKISRRHFLRSSAALGIAAATPFVLSSTHASAQAADSYDYIVVGAGAGGCAVAARLAEDPTKTVLVLEAGPPDTDQNIHVPAAFPYLFGTPLDWGYSSTDQAGLNGRNLFMPRGKVFGGSTSMNAMIYIRGDATNYDGWAKDNPGWGYDDVLPYFIKGENFEHGASDTHGADGPLNVADQRDPNVLSKAMITAAVEQGYEANDDFNSGDMTGFGLYHVTQKGGMRESAAGAYLHPVLEQDNITIQGEAMAHKLLISSGHCSGVRFESGGEMHDVTANAEVILCGGAFGSPQLLMLSGVGPAADLKALGIAVELDVPGVGQNLQEHAMAPVSYACTQPVTLAGANTPEQAELLGKGMGLLTSNIGEAGGFMTVNDDANAPDLQFIFAPNYFIADGAGNPDGHGFTLMPGLVGTKSSGAVTLVSADPNVKVAVDPAMFAEDHDLEIIVTGVKIARKILQSAAFDDYRGEEFMPGKDVQSDDEIREFIRNNVQTIYHPVGTCKMGSDDMAVVDARLRVRGISGLRVADASIMPTITNGNTQAPCMMIGEKCADMIKADA